MKNFQLQEFLKKCLLFLGFHLCYALVIAQTPSPKSNTPYAFGFEVEESYLRSISVFYTYPGALYLLQDFTALDIAYMQPSKEVVRVYNGVDQQGQRAFYNEFLEIKHQGLPHIAPVKSLLYLEGKFTLTSEDGMVSDDVYNYGSEMEPEDPMTLQSLMDIRPEVLKDGRLRYNMDSLVLVVDETNGSLFMNILDEEGLWLSKVYIQYDTRDKNRSVPLVELSTERDYSPSGNCIFRTQETRYTQYEKRDKVSRRENRDHRIFEKASQVVEVLPNPAVDRFSLVLHSWEENEEYLLEIFSLDGKKMYQANLRDKIHIVDSSQWPQGIYAARILGQEKIMTAKIIIQ